MGLTPKKSLTTINTTTRPNSIPDFPPAPYNNDKTMCKLFNLMKMHRNVLLVGGHGIGKTRITLQISDWLNLRMKHMNAATLDPYADLAGIPVVDVVKRLVEFIHDSDLDNYDVFFIDEINRPSHSKVLNGLLELIQFGSVQGRKFKRLKMCWAAMNPPNQNYNVDDLDPTLLDRFHNYFDLPSVYSVAFFETRFDKFIGRTLVEWALELSDDKRKVITPRRLEYIGETIMLFNNDSEMAASSVMSGTLALQDFKILTTKLAPAFGNLDNTATRANAKIQGLVQTQKELNQEALAKALGQI